MFTAKAVAVLFAVLITVHSQCFDPTPAFPTPRWGEGGKSLASTIRNIEEKIEYIVSKEKYDASSFSIELTSSSDTIWSMHHTARHRNESRPGTDSVNADSVYRISAVTKVFTVLALLQQLYLTAQANEGW